jgi:ABC-type nitrate/sulfonate/bicarbonate transport system substrate-binding protein
MMQLPNRSVLISFFTTIMLLGSDAVFAQKIRIFAGSSPVFAPVFIADQKGYFKKEGLDVLVRPFTSGAEATEGFRSGAADFLVASDVPLIYLLTGGDTVMLAQFSANQDMLVIVGPKGAAAPSDLKGKKIGLVTKSASEYLLNNYLKRAGLGVSHVERVHLAPFDQVPALTRGDVYALSTWKPFDLKIAEIGGGKYQVAANNGQEKYVLFSGIVAKQGFVSKSPADTQKVIRALVGASQWLAKADLKTRSEAVGNYLKTDPKDVQHVIANNSWDMTVTPAFTSTMVDIEEFLAKQGLIKARVNWKSAYDFTILQKLDARLVP